MKKLSQSDRLRFAYAAFAGKISDTRVWGIGRSTDFLLCCSIMNSSISAGVWFSSGTPCQFVFMDESGECSQQGALGWGALISFQHESFDLRQLTGVFSLGDNPQLHFQ